MSTPNEVMAYSRWLNCVVRYTIDDGIEITHARIGDTWCPAEMLSDVMLADLTASVEEHEKETA